MPVTSAGSSQLLADLTPSQSRAVTASCATVCVLASAGAGKTRVLTRRVAYRVATGTAQAEHVLAITFTRKAAGELRERLMGLGLGQAVTAGTFHSLALSQLRRWWADRRTPEPALVLRKGRLLAELACGRPGLADVSAGDLASHVEWAKARLVSPATFAAAAIQAQRELPADAEVIASVYARYEDEKRRRRLVDFDDLLVRYADALESDSRFAAAQRWRWQHLFVDELQDVNPLQCRLLLALLGGNDDLFVVGDPNQAIYGWNGADPGFLADFPQRWPQAEVVQLDDNHRSSPQVVAAASAVLGRQAIGAVRSSQPDGPLPHLRSYASEDTEADGVASQLREAHGRGLSWDKMAVLARTNSQLDVVGQALGRAGIPFVAVAPVEDADGDDEYAQRGPGPGGEHVTICSFHRAKGLQWTAVWVCGLEAGFVPIAYASSPAALSEERRLLYVALTRAERELHCSWARERRSTSRVPLRREPSPWLAALASHCAGTGAETAAGGAGGGADAGAVPRGSSGAAVAQFLASARNRLSVPRGGPAPHGESSGPDSTVVAGRLREWRQRLARASGVPPHVLLHDSTVLAIAARRPTTTDDLLAVPGLGPVKVARFGPAILEVVREAELATAAEARHALVLTEL
jgi:DNA helicase-2/ATP-dependent DNA helicase PcrA